MSCSHERTAADDHELPPPWFEFCRDCRAMRYLKTADGQWSAWFALGRIEPG